MIKKKLSHLLLVVFLTLSSCTNPFMERLFLSEKPGPALTKPDEPETPAITYPKKPDTPETPTDPALAWNAEDFGPGEFTISSIFDVSNTAEWADAVSAITSDGKNANYIINVIGDFTVPGVTDPTFGGGTGIKVSLRGVGRTVGLSSNGSLIRIGTDQTVILRDLTLKGRSGNNASVVYMRWDSSYSTFIMRSGEISGNSDRGVKIQSSESTFTMHSGKISGNSGGGVEIYGEDTNTFTMYGGKISGNITTSFLVSGGGVSVAWGTFTMHGGEISGNTVGGDGGGVLVDATFIMNGGTISGNTGSSGGGVAVRDNGASFTMHGGTISGNTADGYGGGVYLEASPIFRIVNGTIYGSNEADPSLRNTAVGDSQYIGHALFWGGSYDAPQYGRFNGGTWSGTNLTVDADGNYNNTIRVVNGELQLTDDEIDFGSNPVITRITVSSQADWYTAIDAIKNGGPGNYVINVTGNVDIPGNGTANTFGNTTTGIKVSLRGSGTLTVSGNGSLISQGGNQTVLLRDLTLQGNDTNNESLVRVSGTNGAFVMHSGAITGNTNTSGAGGGVNVYSASASFTMYGGEISGNTASNGGGVYINTGASFTMHGGTISDNTATGAGGGVYMQTGTVRFVAGIIYGNEAAVDESLKNNATNGAALYLYINSGTAQRGTFSGETWIPTETLETRNDTIQYP